MIGGSHLSADETETKPGLPRVIRALRTVTELARTAGIRPLIAVATAQIVYGVTTPVRIFVLQRLLGALSNPHARSSLIVPAMIFVVVLAAGGCAQLVQRERGRLLGEIAARAAFDRVLDATQVASLPLFDDSLFHDQLSRAKQAQFRCSQALTAVFAIAGSVLASVGVLIALGSVNWLLLPVALIAALPVTIASRLNSVDEYLFTHRLAPIERQRTYIESLLTERQPAKEIRAFDLAPFLRAIHGQLQDERLESLRLLARHRMQRIVLSSLLASAASASIAGVLFWLYFAGRMSLATAGAAIYGFMMLASQLRSVSVGATNLYESLLFVAQLDDFVSPTALHRSSSPSPNRPARSLPAQGPFKGATMEDVVFTYPTGTSPAVRGVSLRIEPGEMVALVGPNGSGKTTVAKLLAGLYAPETGRIVWGDTDRAELAPEVVADQVAIGFQDFERFRMSVSDNIGLGRHERRLERDAIVAAAERTRADRFATPLPEGFDTLLGPEFAGGRELSQGQWQRLALARVFFRDAPVVILDEPAAALDALAEFELFESMRRGLEGRCAVVISHRLATVRSADRIYVLDHGRIVEEGRHEDLVAHHGLYAQMYDVQARAYRASAESGATVLAQQGHDSAVPEFTLRR